MAIWAQLDSTNPEHIFFTSCILFLSTVSMLSFILCQNRDFLLTQRHWAAGYTRGNPYPCQSGAG